MPIAHQEGRIRFITHRGKQILLVDLSRCSPAEAEEILRRVPDVVTMQPLRSVRLLSDFTGASFTAETLRTMKETAVFNKTHVSKTAWIGADSLPASLREEVSRFSRREFPIFDDRNSALDWLAED
jgi:hypothetical protein